MSNIWLLLLSRIRVRRPRWFIPFVAVFAVGLIMAGLIYAYVVFHAVSQRSRDSHVPAYSAH